MATAFLRGYLLPCDYPESVSEDYLEYQFWDTLQGLMQYLKGVICTLSYLRGLGVGAADSSLHGAMVIWVIRDGTACFSGLAAGNPSLTRRFAERRQVKAWRLVAETTKGAAGLVVLAASTGPAHRFLPLVCVAACAGSVAGVIDSCTRSSLMTHFARRGNFSDCSAKEGNQDRAVKLVGIACACRFLGSLGNSPRAAWLAYALLTGLHLGFNGLALRALRLDDDADPKRD